MEKRVYDENNLKAMSIKGNLELCLLWLTLIKLFKMMMGETQMQSRNKKQVAK